uniref:Uncharacterized protein n=1 Tax=Salix viminalis TaxID=40686 RepID=A0A6N2LTC5_SALVM
MLLELLLNRVCLNRFVVFKGKIAPQLIFLGILGLEVIKGIFLDMEVASNYECTTENMEVSPSDKRARAVEFQNPSATYPPPPLKGEQTGPLRASSLIEMEMDKLLEDSVPCRVRAKRGCATHPRQYCREGSENTNQ